MLRAFHYKSILSLLGLLILMGSLAFAQQPRDLHKTRVQSLLMEKIEEEDQAQWQEVGEQIKTLSFLMEFVYDKDISMVIRSRSVMVFRFFPVMESRQFLWGIVHDRQAGDSLKIAAMASLGAAFQKEVLLEISRYLQNTSSVLREGAIRGLGWIEDGRARTVLENHLATEEIIELRLECEKAITRIKKWEQNMESERRLRNLENQLRENLGEGDNP